MSSTLPRALSPSRLQDFQTCPRRFQHSAIDRIRQPATYATLKGTFVHHIFERLFEDVADSRSIERATELISDAESAVLTGDAADDVGLDDVMRDRLRSEAADILRTYFEMEDPTSVSVEGVELRLEHDVSGVPMLGILDRLDREPDDSLTIVDYKTGAVPNRQFDSQTFANTELYAALCEEALGRRPRRIRLLYVTHGAVAEREVTDPVVRARRQGVVDAWHQIQANAANGEFPARPSRSACRFCAYRELCRENGVAVV